MPDWREGMMTGGAEGGDDSWRGQYDEKELKKRQEIVDRFNTIGIKDDINVLTELTTNAEYREVAFKPRIAFTPEQNFLLNQTLLDINTHIQMAQIVLDAYVRFPTSVPDFASIKNVIFGFHSFLSDESSKSFHIERVNREGIHYYPNKTYKSKDRHGQEKITQSFTTHVKNVTYMLSRLVGAIELSGWYLIDVEGEKMENTERFGGGYDRFGGGYGGLGGYGGYGGYDRFGGYGGVYDPLNRGNINVTKMNIKKDIGDDV